MQNTGKQIISARTSNFTESIIREMTRMNSIYGGVNLAQGFPDFNPPQELIDAAVKAMNDGYNQYSITWGSPRLRQAIAEKAFSYNGIESDPEKNITVTCGATEAMMASMMAIINPGDEVILFEPFYENYGPDSIVSGAKPVYVRLYEPDFHFDPVELKKAFTPATKAIIINTPHNPSGKVFNQDELEYIAELCAAYNVLVVTDEIYEHILYDGCEHISPASIPGLENRTITINSISKTYSATGWRVGWAIAPEEITNAIRKIHDFLTVGAAAPLQEAAVTALHLPESYYTNLASYYSHKREIMIQALNNTGFKVFNPKGAYYILTDFSNFGYDDDMEFAKHLISDAGVAAVPGRAFYSNAEDAKSKIRFTFCKKEETLLSASKNIREMNKR